MKCVVDVGDLHAGSLYGLLPPEFEKSDGSICPQNEPQKYLWECWDSFGEQVSKYPVAAIVANGDMVDGLGFKVKGGEQSLNREAEQARAAVLCMEHLLKKFPKRPRLLHVAGTDYHVGTLGREEEGIAQALKAEIYEGEGAGYYIKEVLNLEVDGVMGNFAHHLSFAPVNKTQPIDKELQGALLEELDGNPTVDYLIRNHVHYYRSVGAGYRHGATSPCWQLKTKFGRRSGVFRFKPDVGGLVIWIDGDAKRAGDDPVRIQPILYPLPKFKVHVVQI